MRNPTTPSNAHGVTHTRPIVARGVHFNAANEGLTTEQIVESALAERRQAIAARREAEERAQAEYARYMEERRRLAASRQPQEDRPVYRCTCSLCGDPSESQVCGRCSEGYERLGL